MPLLVGAIQEHQMPLHSTLNPLAFSTAFQFDLSSYFTGIESDTKGIIPHFDSIARQNLRPGIDPGTVQLDTKRTPHVFHESLPIFLDEAEMLPRNVPFRQLDCVFREAADGENIFREFVFRYGTLIVCDLQLHGKPSPAIDSDTLPHNGCAAQFPKEICRSGIKPVTLTFHRRVGSFGLAPFCSRALMDEESHSPFLASLDRKGPVGSACGGADGIFGSA